MFRTLYLMRRLGLICLFLGLLNPVAEAKSLSLWAAAKGVHSSGTSDLFVYFDGPIAGGLEAGVEVLNIDLFGEAMLMGDDQYLFTANLGVDFDFGEDLWLEIGAFTGPIFFHFPQVETESGLDWSALSAEEESILTAIEMSPALMFSRSDLEREFDMYSQADEELSRWVFGWNLVRVRVAAGVALFPGFHLGVVGQIGYHMLIEGEDIAAGAKNAAIDRLAEENPEIPIELLPVLRKAVGAKPVDKDALNGFNYNFGAMVRVQF